MTDSSPIRKDQKEMLVSYRELLKALEGWK